MNVSCILQVLICATATATQGLSDAPDTNKSIFDAVCSGDAERLQVLLQNPLLDPADDNNRAIFAAVQLGQVDCFRLLLKDKRVDPTVHDSYLIEECVRKGNADCLRLILEDKQADPASRSSMAIQIAAQKPSAACLKLLLEDGRANPTFGFNAAFGMAAGNGYEEHIRLLLADPRMNPIVGGSSALCTAVEFGHFGCAKALLEDPRMDLREINLDELPLKVHKFITLISMYTDFLFSLRKVILATSDDIFYVLIRRHRDSPKEFDYLLDIQLERLGVTKEAKDFAACKAFVAEKISTGLKQPGHLAVLLNAFLIFRTMSIDSYPKRSEQQ